MKKRKFELDHLLKWRNTLDKCIRCGYCYEHCPVFKHTRWESDAPRAKLTMLYGLLSGRLEPSTYIADKIFSCFNCQQCVAACSSGVPITEILTDARADFAGTEFDTTGTTSITGHGCANCLTCVRACPHDARYFKDGHIITDPVLCQSCGICSSLCPNQSVSALHSYGTDRVYLNRMISEFLKKESAKVIVFGCNWSYYPDLQSSSYEPESSSYLPIYEQPEPEYKILINMCGGRLTKPLLLDAFLENAWGVLVACCPDGECENNGNLKAVKSVKGLKPVLESLDINPDRLDLVHISHGDKAGFQKAIDAFVEKVKGLGSPVSERAMNDQIRSARNEQTRSVK